MSDLTSNFSPTINIPSRFNLSIRTRRLRLHPGRFFLTTLERFGKAIEMAYVAPYQASRKGDNSPEFLPDGRNPNW